MPEQRIEASPVEIQTLSQRLADANLAQSRLQEIFTIFCEGHGVSGATFVSLERGVVVVDAPDIRPATT